MKRTKTMKHLVQDLIEAGMSESESGPIEGCSSDQIADLEVQFGVRLPATYKEFLSLMGKNTAEFLSDCIVCIPAIAEYRFLADQLCSQYGITLPPTAFVFLIRNTDQILFFECSGNEDPPVMHYLEQEPAPKQVAGKFSEWLACCVDDEIKAWKDS